ncbi:CDP-glucose 4,6-dehydratase [Nitrincola sp. MINF-07-Sa-05]|uniref:CDP-glucose 4,6-dehydratase n=1 Tax=Nitrincola salilacus TaxID=3400273 RepID=UPI003918073D
MNKYFWHGKRVLITGHTGFKGSWLAIWLKKNGADVYGFSLPPSSEQSLYNLAGIDSLCNSHINDIRDPGSILSCIKNFQPEIIFHLAAQAFVLASYKNPIDTFSTNTMGTVNLLDAVRSCSSTRVVICVTTDKVYKNNEWPWPYRETDKLGGIDPYSASKAASELVIKSYRESYFNESSTKVAIASARAGNVIGGGDWSENRLIPDAIRAWESGQQLEVRSPNSIRPWQHVLDCMHSYTLMAEKLYYNNKLAGAYNFGPPAAEAASVREVVTMAMDMFGNDANTKFHQITSGLHEASELKLDTSLASSQFGIKNHWSLKETIAKTIYWYQAARSGNDALELCNNDINAYEKYNE